MDELNKIKDSLSSNEIKILKNLSEDFIEANELSAKLNLSYIEVMRAVLWLKQKHLVETKTEVKEAIELDENGKRYLKYGLPERRVLEVISKVPISIRALKDKLKDSLSEEEINVSLGILKKKAAININKGILEITSAGNNLLNKGFLEEKFLKELPLSDLNDQQKYSYESLNKRKDIIKKSLQKLKFIKLSELGKKLLELGLEESDFIERLTHQSIVEGDWKGKRFKRYDVKADVPQINAGKRHFVMQAINYAKRIWLEMGFKEMTGSLVQTSFWVFDALFTAQDHPVREMQDTFFVEDPEYGKLPDEKIVNLVREAHERGVKGSRGWQYKWDPNEARRNVLRTHTTVLSAKTLYEFGKELKEGRKIKGKYFAIGRNFRNEAVDWSHLFEFNQTEGIVIDPDANFRQLLGYLKVFFEKMGFPNARFRPAFFSYTEPSVEIDVWHPKHKKWMELGGAGMFRPEVTVPLLGEEIPVLAWGPGFDRIILDFYDITDIRDLYKNDLMQIAQAPAWFK